MTWGMRKPKRAHPEATLQTAIAKYLRAVLKPPVWFTSIAHGVRLDDNADIAWLRGAQAQGRGTKSGVPDMLIIDAGRAYWGEVKSMTGSLSDAQHETITAIKRARCPVAIWRSIDDVKASLAEWGIPTREARSVEGIVQGQHISLTNWPDSGPLVRRKGAK